MENLSAAKQTLLEKWLQGERSVQPVTTIPRRDSTMPLKISLTQQRHLFLELFDRTMPVNNLSVFIRLKGKLEPAFLENSANEILSRHEVLRTRYSFESGIPKPEIKDHVHIDIEIISLKQFTEEERDREGRSFAEKEVLRYFDLSKAPLLRLTLFQLDKEEHFLLLVVHHSIADGWSLGVFLKELMVLYTAQNKGAAAILPELPVQYYDYAHWQIDEQMRGDLDGTLSYWKKQLGGELPILDLPVDNSRGTKQTYNGGTYRFGLPVNLANDLELLGQEEGATLFMTLLTVFYELLHRYSGQDDILVGTPIANRSFPELEPLIGIFINTLVLRARLSGNPSFRNLLRQVKSISLEAYAHQDVPFERLIEVLKPKRAVNRPPLFQVIFNLQNTPMPKLQMAGVELEFLDLDRGVSQYDLGMTITKKPGGYEATVEYNADLFGYATIERMCYSYQRLLEQAVDYPDQPLSVFEILKDEELEHVVSTINQTQQEFRLDKGIHELIEDQVEQTPDATALICDDVCVTYQELNLRANTLAALLRENGVGPEVRVGIWMKKSIETVIALLGILKAGGAYVPISVAAPFDRLKFILEDSGAKLLLTNIGSDDLQNLFIPVLNVTGIVSKSECQNLSSLSSPDNLVYIIYTSGSTGRPKGVMVSHRSLLNFLWSMRDAPGMNKDSVVLALSPISFDPSTLELFLPLMIGAKIVIASDEMRTDPRLIAETIHQQKINFAQATPTTWKLLLASGWTGEQGLKILCGGEILTRKLANELLQRVESLWNVYGPTETTVWCSVIKVSAGNTLVPMGPPISNMQFYILNEHLQPVPIGVPGELYIAGIGLAREYMNNRQLTQEKFIPNRFSNEKESRLYKTGDWARYLPDFNIQFLGRTDDQVKMQGHRIELDEINAVLMQHPLVKEAFTLVRTEGSDEKRLIAYFVTTTLDPLATGELREFLGKKLPGYMIPSLFFQMEALPINSNGKVDRKALPLPETLRRTLGHVAPRNAKEQILTEIWQNVLSVEEIGINDNFFELGGASIQSIQVVAQAQMYGYGITVAKIFEHQTIAELAMQLE